MARQPAHGNSQLRFRMNPALLAPCGMNCNRCSSYLAYTHAIPRARGKITHCRGCGPQGKTCAYLKKWCRFLAEGEVHFCFECPDFPCNRLEHLDRRYRTRYHESLIENLRHIQKEGIASFVRKQEQKFSCPKCHNDVICIHNSNCYTCDTVRSWRA